MRAIEVKVNGEWKPYGGRSPDGLEWRYVGGVLEVLDDGDWVRSNRQEYSLAEARVMTYDEYRLRPYDDEVAALGERMDRAKVEEVEDKARRIVDRVSSYAFVAAPSSPSPHADRQTIEHLTREVAIEVFGKGSIPVPSQAPAMVKVGQPAMVKVGQPNTVTMSDAEFAREVEKAAGQLVEAVTAKLTREVARVTAQRNALDEARAKQGDELGALRSENDELLRENARLRRKLESVDRKVRR